MPTVVLFLAFMTMMAIVPSARAELACSKLDDAKLDQCLAGEAKSSTARMVGALKAARKAADQVCSNVPSPAIGGCLEKAQHEADLALEREYKAALSYIESEAASKQEASSWKQRLQASQQAWAAFKGADCGGLIDLEWMHGTGAGAAAMQCQLEKTWTRSEDLRGRYRDR